MNIVTSKNQVPIRFSSERWIHIIEEHPEMAEYYDQVLQTIAEPEVIYLGTKGECLATREVILGKYLVAIYRELTNNDGFVIIAFLTRRKTQLERRQQIWPS